MKIKITLFLFAAVILTTGASAGNPPATPAPVIAPSSPASQLPSAVELYGDGAEPGPASGQITASESILSIANQAGDGQAIAFSHPVLPGAISFLPHPPAPRVVYSIQPSPTFEFGVRHPVSLFLAASFRFDFGRGHRS
jgi:hypothetical protein